MKYLSVSDDHNSGHEHSVEDEGESISWRGQRVRRAVDKVKPIVGGEVPEHRLCGGERKGHQFDVKSKVWQDVGWGNGECTYFFARVAEKVNTGHGLDHYFTG